MRRRRFSNLPKSLPNWLHWPAFEAAQREKQERQKSPKQKREKANWRQPTEIERRAILAYKKVSTPWPSYARRLQRTTNTERVTDAIMRWIWFYVHKFRRQIADRDVIREAERQSKDMRYQEK